MRTALGRRGRVYHEDRNTTLVIAQRLLVLAAPGYITGDADEHEKPVSDQAGNASVGMWTTDREDITGRAAAGRAGSFNPEEQRSSRFRSYGPPLRKNGYVLSGVERTGPPGGCPARVARRGWAGGG
jgi:hypothetical protein